MTAKRTPTLGETINKAVRLALADLFKVRIGRVESFDASTGLANVKPLVKDTFDDEAGSTLVELPVISSVPVFVLGGGSFSDTCPIGAGDECLLLIVDQSIDVWHKLGGASGPVDPKDARRHNVTDAIALVGVRSEPRKLTEWDTARRVIGAQGGPRIALSSTDIHLGVTHNESATEAAILGTTYRQKEDELLQALASALSQAATAITAASVAIGAAGVANTPPMVGGAAAAPSFAIATTQLANAGSALAGVASAFATFFAADALTKSQKVKVK